MRTQEEIGAYLRERIAAHVTLAGMVTSQAITTIDEAGDATTQLLDGLPVMPIVAVLDGAFSRARLTGQGYISRFNFDVLLYLVNVPEGAEIDEMALRALMANLEDELAAFVIAEGGNTSMWNSIDYAGELGTNRASSDLVATLAQTLFAAKVIPLQITSFQ